MRRKYKALLTSLALSAASACSHAAGIEAYRVTLRPDFASHAIAGVEHLGMDGGSGGVLQLPIHQLQVDAVERDGQPLPYHIADGKLELPMIRGRQAFTITYHGIPDEGLIFGSNHVASTWQASDWMICDEEPGTKAPIEITLLLPQGYTSIASGTLQEKQALGTLERHVWREPDGYSSYLYGFAAGKLHHVEEQAGKVSLHYYGVADDETALRRKFAPTAGMLAFLQDKAGVAMPHGTYRQLLIPGSEAQELSSFSVIGTAELDPMQQEPQEDWVIVHEMAHQWWGNLLTCKTWADFWLNEGITTFMVAAYKEERWGLAAYDKELALAKKRWQSAIDAGHDKPLAYAGDYPSLKIRRAIQYSKGAIFMDALRRELGETAFWNGLRRYTREHAGGSVTSRDLQVAMEQASGRNLGALFAKWVY